MVSTSRDELSLGDFEYDLPTSRIAQRPAATREGARLLVVPRDDAPLCHAVYQSLPELVRGDELLVLNDTRVVPARVWGNKPTGGRVELLVTGIDPERPDRVIVMGRASKALRAGTPVAVGDHWLTVTDVLGEGRYRVALPEGQTDIWAFLDTHGQVPLPPYIVREEGPDARDVERYQTVFAEHPGSVAAPTAGLHFTPALLAALRRRGCSVATVTLHVGPGTFRPVRTGRLADHPMHGERFAISEEAALAIRAARTDGRPVLAVGTTVVRTLEGVAAAHGEVVSMAGETAIFIRPGWRFRVVDQLLTNFHLPRSTLLMLVSALLGHARTMSVYATAVREGYRFYSYGDGMWVR